MDYEEHLLSVKSRRPVFLMFFHFLINHEQMKKKKVIYLPKDVNFLLFYRPVSWADFLRESAIYILAARPNSSAMHIHLPL